QSHVCSTSEATIQRVRLYLIKRGLARWIVCYNVGNLCGACCRKYSHLASGKGRVVGLQKRDHQRNVSKTLRKIEEVLRRYGKDSRAANKNEIVRSDSDFCYTSECRGGLRSQDFA